MSVLDLFRLDGKVAVVTGAAQGYLIDRKTAEKYHITNIAQLKDQKLAKLFAWARCVAIC